MALYGGIDWLIPDSDAGAIRSLAHSAERGYGN